MTQARFKAHRHTFRFKTDDGQVILARAKVRAGKLPVKLVLKAQHVRDAIAAHGIGNTQTCAMAQCAKASRSLFPHTFLGYIDWQYSRCYVVSKLDRNRMPCECFVYLHGDDIAKLNDTPGGQQQLLDDLVKNGDKTIHLSPMRKRAPQKGGGQGRKDGSRTSSVMGVGARLRYATAKLGGIEV